MPSQKDGIRMGDEGKAAGYGPSSGGFAHELVIRSVMTITEFTVSSVRP